MLSNTKLFAGAALLFAVASFLNVNAESASASGGLTLVITDPAQIETRLGPTIPPDPWEEPPGKN